MKHTPGPWRRFGGMVDGYGIASDGGVVVEQSAFNGIENEANARLIAAAPDLLAGCELALDYVESLIEPEEDCPARKDAAKLRAAIAKAKGE